MGQDAGSEAEGLGWAGGVSRMRDGGGARVGVAKHAGELRLVNVESERSSSRCIEAGEGCGHLMEGLYGVMRARVEIDRETCQR